MWKQFKRWQEGENETKDKMGAINPIICAVTITVNRLNDPVKRQQCQIGLKQSSSYMLFIRAI